MAEESESGSEQQTDGGARIEVQPNGPYVVFGRVPLTRRRTVASEHGESMTTQEVHRYRTRETMALCRCGGSTHKPYCDGSHARLEFGGSETAATTTYADRAKTYEATKVIVRDDRSICEHAGFCGNRLTNVWKMLSGSDTEDTILRSQMMSMIERCPSGALTYQVDGDEVEPEYGMRIAAIADGPLFVMGAIPVQRADGQPMEVRNRVTLCRCGQSSNKPLCDGSHKEIGFTDAKADEQADDDE
jgi:CDGSH-type Zn-finger protein